MKKLVITSAAMLATIIKNNPSLNSIPVFASINQIANTPAPTAKNCNCKAKAGPTQEMRNQMETFLRNADQGSFAAMKGILNLDQVCFYTMQDRKLVLTCI